MPDMEFSTTSLRVDEEINNVSAVMLKSGVLMHVSSVSFANVIWSDPANRGSEMRSDRCLLVTHVDDDRDSGHRAVIPQENIAVFYIR